MGWNFQVLGMEEFPWVKEGGHSKRRVLHVKDVTGKAIEEALLANIAKQGVDLFEHYFAIDLMLQKTKKAGYAKWFRCPSGGRSISWMQNLVR